MSMAMQKAKYTGDPGLFGFLKGVAKVGLGLAGTLPGVGGIARTLSGAIFPPAPGTTTYAQMPNMGIMPQFPQAGPGGVATSRQEFDCRGSWASVANRYGRSIPEMQRICGSEQQVSRIVGAPGIRAAIERAVPGGATGLMVAQEDQGMAAMQAGKPCPVSGYHWNKSGYFLLSGEYVYPGTKMVKNRRRNPANPRATSNAITRLKGAKRYAKSLSAISIRKC